MIDNSESGLKHNTTYEDTGRNKDTSDWGAADDDPYRVYPRYKDLKEEILHYKQLSREEYDVIYTKATRLIDTDIARSLKATVIKFGDVNSKDTISKNHLISIILYTDYTNLSADFTRSFRKLNRFDLLKQIKQRNSKYFHWSKTLRESVSGFGQKRKVDDKCLSLLGHLDCKVYTGMSVVLNITQFNIALLSPTSTSANISVAIKFGGAKGMVMEFDNSQGKGQRLRAMDCSWISRFREEDERYVHIFAFLSS